PEGNGITSDLVSQLIVDQTSSLDQVNVDCGAIFDAPQFIAPSPCNQNIDATVGSPVAFTVTASDIDVGDIVTLTPSGAPAGSTSTPPLPENGNPVSTTFDWTPGGGDVGSHVITFTATDQTALSTDCKVTVTVGGSGCGGDPGFLLTAPDEVGIGEFFDM